MHNEVPSDAASLRVPTHTSVGCFTRSPQNLADVQVGQTSYGSYRVRVDIGEQRQCFNCVVMVLLDLINIFNLYNPLDRFV